MPQQGLDAFHWAGKEEGREGGRPFRAVSKNCWATDGGKSLMKTYLKLEVQNWCTVVCNELVGMGRARPGVAGSCGSAGSDPPKAGCWSMAALCRWATTI